ncbi:MAG: hypothetical protein ACQEUB_12580, partial [Thermodesulfobacteriota bacterium]
TMEGSKRWPTKKRLLRFATNHCGLQHRQAIKILEDVKEGTRKAQKELEHGIKYLEGFYEIGQKISEQWKLGLLT